MNADELRAMQAPIKQKYKENPNAAVVTLRAEGRIDISFGVLGTTSHVSPGKNCRCPSRYSRSHTACSTARSEAPKTCTPLPCERSR